MLLLHTPLLLASLSVTTTTIITLALLLVPSSQAGFELNRSLEQPSSLVPASTTVLNYHGGPLLTGPKGINIYLIWYGSFYQKERTPITDFFASFTTSLKGATVATWWHTILSYKDKRGYPVSSSVKLAKQLGDVKYSLGKKIKRAQIASYIKSKIDNKLLPLDPHGVYMFLTSKDVHVNRFCTSSCGFHDSFMTSGRMRLVYAHVGDPIVQCPGLCSWPYAIPAYGPPGQAALVAPNGVGTDGIIMNIATILAGAATNPFKNGYFQGDALVPLEAVTACPGIFGPGAYPGYPGDLKVGKGSRASFNAYGVNGRMFLLPAMWERVKNICKVVA